MSEKEDVQCFDFDNDELNPGDTINVYDYLNNSWKSAVVQEIDIGEREILVNYEDDSQEWISVDTRKISFIVPEETLGSPVPSFTLQLSPEVPTPPILRKRSNTVKVAANNESNLKKCKLTNETDTKEISVNKNKNETTSQVESVRHTRSKELKKNEKSKVVLTKPVSSFPRLKFKSNEIVNRKRDKREQIRNKNKFVKTENITNVSSETTSETTIKKSKNQIIKSGKNAKENVRIKINETSNSIPRKKSKRDDAEKEDICTNSVELLKRKSAQRRDSIAVSTESTTKPSEKNAPFIAAANKKIKTLLPKRIVSEAASETALTSSVISLSPDAPVSLHSSSLSSIYPTANVLPLNITPTSSGFMCPKQDCNKHFRNENLLMMHIKHYHREYRNMLSSTPNVADLAYARTVGENIEAPQSGFLEKIVKLEEDRKKEKTDPDSSLITSDNETMTEKSVEENASASFNENIEKLNEQSPKSQKSSKKISMSKRPSMSSAPSSPNVSVLVAQLQEPPLLPSSVTIQSDNEFSMQSSPATPGSPQIVLPKSKAPNDKLSPSSDAEDKINSKKRSLLNKKQNITQLDNTDVVNCTCGYGFDDGLMMMCELCLCWQHATCNSVENESETPTNYICKPCQFPRRQHASKKYDYAQIWQKCGKLPSFDFVQTRKEVTEKREEYLQLSHEFLCNLTELKYAVHSLQVKIQILRQTPNHPKLYLWAKSWDDKKVEEEQNQIKTNEGPVPEAAINTADCRKYLSEHIEEEMKKVDVMLRNLEDKIEKLHYNVDDEEDNFGNEPEKDRCGAKQTLLMMLRDLSLIQNLKYC